MLLVLGMILAMTITESSLVHAMDSEDESEFENDEFNEGQNEDTWYAFLGLL